MVNTLTALLCAGITLNAVAAVPIVAPGTFGASHAPARLDGVRPVYRREPSIPERRGLFKSKSKPSKPSTKQKPTKKKSSSGGGFDLFGAGTTMTGGADLLNAGLNAWSAAQPAAEAPVDPAAPVRRALGKKGKSPPKTTTKPATKQGTKPGTKPATSKKPKSGGSGVDLFGAGTTMTGGADLLNAGMNAWSATQPAPATDPAAPVRRALTKKPGVKMPSGKKITPTKPGAKKPAANPAAAKPKSSWRSKLPGMPKMPSIDGYSAGMAMTGVGDLINAGTNAWAATRPAPSAPAEAAPAEVPAEDPAAVPARRAMLYEREWDEYIYDELD